MKTNLYLKKCSIIYTLLLFSFLIPLPDVYAQLAKCKGKYFGNIIQGSVRSDYTTYWNQATSENGSKWGSVEGTKGVYNFNNSDLAYNWAKNNNGLFKYHNFVWGAQTPGWVSGASTATITTAIENYIKAVANHYGPMGGLKLIDVLNEPVNTAMPGNMKAALTAGYQAEPANANDKNNQYGWVIWPFQLTRKYFPDATLLINEYNIEMNWNNCRAPYIAMVNAIKNAPNLTDGKKNLIDGVGLQCHGIDNLTAANFKACIDEIWTKTGVPIHITEFDQTANPNESKQQSVYSTLIPVAWEHPHVAGITLWGYIQGSTWINGNGTAGPSGTDSGLLYSPNYSAKPNGERPAMTWLKQYFTSQTSLSCCPAPAPFASCNNNTNTPPSVAISSPANNATFTAPASITITATASDADGTVSNVQFFNGSTLLGSDATSPYSFSWTSVAAGTYTLTAKATDNAGATTTSASVTVTVSNPVAQSPYNGTPAPIPGKIEAENYDLGGQGVSFNETTTGNSGNAYRTDDVDVETTGDTGGGYDVGYIASGEWLEYTVNVTATGVYNLQARVASANTGGALHVEMNGVDISGAITVPNTGDWQIYQTVTISNINLTAGQKVMRIAMDASWFNLNYVSFTPVNTPPTVSITAPANNATFTAPASVTITANAADADGSVSSVQFFNGTTLLGSDATAPYSFTWSDVASGTYTIMAKATDNAGAITTSSAITVVVNPPAVTQAPYNGTPASIPGTIQAEEYDLGGQGVAFNETTADNSGNAFRTDDVDIEATTDAGGGYNVGWIASGEWLEYTVNVTTSGVYNLAARVASANTGGALHIEMDGVDISGAITVPNTGDWQTFQTVTISNISLTAGQKVMRIAMDASWFNLNYVSFTPVGPNTPPTVSITAPADSASFTAPASISITASASDEDGTISTVQFYNGTTLLGSDATAPYNFTWANVAAGSYTVTAKATDNSGAVTTSATVVITVEAPANVPPAVSITAPANNASFTAPASISITASASDSDGTISNVQFFNGTTLLGSDATAPYSFNWTNVAASSYTLTAKATDNSGAVTTSSAVIVTVTAPPVGDLIGPDCASKNTTVTFTLDASKRTNATNYSWWVNGSTQSITPVTGAPYSVNIQTGPNYVSSQVCIGVGYSVSPYYTTYCKVVDLCSSAKMSAVATEEAVISPNPSEGSFTISSNETVDNVTILNMMGEIVYSGKDSSVQLSDDLGAGIYTVVIRYTSGRSESKRIQKTK